MLRHKNPMAGRVDRETFRIANSCSETLSRCERLIYLVRVVTPDAAARFKLRAGLGTGRFESTVLQLAGIRGGADIHVHQSISVYGERVHGMVTAQRQS